jgi:hypothetical protein
MTAINRILKRETPATVRDAGRLRSIIVELQPQDPCLYLRQKGTRRRYALPYEAAYLYAVRLAVDSARREKRKKKGDQK